LGSLVIGNPNEKEELFRRAILRFVLTEAIALFALMMAFFFNLKIVNILYRKSCYIFRKNFDQMPQVDVDYYEDILYVGFLSLLFDGGADHAEEGVIELGLEIILAQYYLYTTRNLFEEKRILAAYTLILFSISGLKLT
jgi:hypothetical protein